MCTLILLEDFHTNPQEVKSTFSLHIMWMPNANLGIPIKKDKLKQSQIRGITSTTNLICPQMQHVHGYWTMKLHMTYNMLYQKIQSISNLYHLTITELILLKEQFKLLSNIIKQDLVLYTQTSLFLNVICYYHRLLSLYIF